MRPHTMNNLKSNLSIFIFLFLIFNLPTYAETNSKPQENKIISVVNSKTCFKLKNTNAPFILVLKRGENVIEKISDCIKTLNIPGAALQGVGALEQPTLAYYNLEKQQYVNKTFPGVFELIALNGDIAYAKNHELVLHTHVVLGNDQYQAIGGHLISARVGVTAEITVIPLRGIVRRELDKETGLKLITAE